MKAACASRKLKDALLKVIDVVGFFGVSTFQQQKIGPPFATYPYQATLTATRSALVTEPPVGNQGRNGNFEQVMLPHLNAAYNLASWLLRDDSAAQDAVQEAFVRALRFFEGFRGDNARPWLLQIVRNTCWTHLRESGRGGVFVELDEELDSNVWDPAMTRVESNPEVLLARRQDSERVNAAIEALPAAFREVLILREMEGLAYAEIAEVAGLPLGTVMSRLYRARALLTSALTAATTVPGRSAQLLGFDRTLEEPTISPWPRAVAGRQSLAV